MSRLGRAIDALRTGRGPAVASVVAVTLAGAALLAIVLVRNLVVDEPLQRLRATPLGASTTRYEGSFYFPRGGPYVLGFEADGPASLFIDDRPVVAGEGRKTSRVVYQAGIAAVRFEAPAGARLLWHPPGRRGPLEYVPPSSLLPEPPDRASFGRFAGASPLDGLFAGLAVLVMLGLCAYLARHRLRRIARDRRAAAGFLAVLVLALGVRLYDLGGAGQTWDEDVNWAAGRNYITNWLSLDFAARSWDWNYEHPPVMKYVAGIGAQWADGYGPARGLSALMMALGCALLVPIGRRLYGLGAGVMAGLVAALSPHLIAHGKVVGHEAPTVLLCALAVWLALTVHDRAAGQDSGPPDARPDANPDAGQDSGPAHGAAGNTHDPGDPLPWRLALLGLVLGLAVFSRFVNGLLVVLAVVIVLVHAPAGRRRRSLALAALIIPVVIVLVGLLIWPRLWSEPIAHMVEAWTKLKKPHSPEPYLGVITNQPPWHYFAVYLVATAPLGVLIGAAAWIWRALRPRAGEARAAATVALWLLVPMLVMVSPVRQDGVRYIMPSLMALALAAGAGYQLIAAALARMLGRAGAGLIGPDKTVASGRAARRGEHLRCAYAGYVSTFAVPQRSGRSSLVAAQQVSSGPPGHPQRLLVATGAALFAYLAVTNARVHPYYLDYYGEQVGGPSAVARDRSFEIAWWGEGLADAVAFINDHAAAGARVFKGCVEPSHLTWLRADLWASEARRPADADWILSYQPARAGGPGADDRCSPPPAAVLAHEVSVKGAPLVQVYRAVKGDARDRAR